MGTRDGWRHLDGLGLLLALRPGSGLVAVVWFVGAYAIVFGVSLIVLGFRLRALRAGMS